MKSLDNILDTLNGKKENILDIGEKLGFVDIRFYNPQNQDQDLHFLVRNSSVKKYNSLQCELDFKVLLEDIFKCRVQVDVLDDLLEDVQSQYVKNSIAINDEPGKIKRFFMPSQSKAVSSLLPPIPSFDGLESKSSGEENSASPREDRSFFLAQAKKRLALLVSGASLSSLKL